MFCSDYNSWWPWRFLIDYYFECNVQTKLHSIFAWFWKWSKYGILICKFCTYIKLLTDNIACQAFLFQVVSINRAKRFLCECGYRYASESLLQSELRVLKTLKFQVTEPSPIVYIETLLEILGNTLHPPSPPPPPQRKQFISILRIK